jgi:recombination protein RecA
MPLMVSASQLRSRMEAVLEPRIPRALTPQQRSAPEMMSTGIASVDSITGGIPLGCLTEICGPSSSGRTSVLLAAIAECVRRGEICALVDASDAFDPRSAANAGVDLARLLWVRCGKTISPRRHGDTEKGLGHRRTGASGSVPSAVANGSAHKIRGPHLSRFSKGGNKKVNTSFVFLNEKTKSTETAQIEQALKTTDLLLQAGGFGLVILDLADIPISAARRIPLTTWFRFRRAVENISTALLIVEQHPHAKSCASLIMDFAAQQATWSEAADQGGTPVGTHGIPDIPSRAGNAPSLPVTNDGVAFRVTSEGVAIPFNKPMTSSFEMQQRWNTPRARLLNTVHVHLQVTRSRMNRVQKFPAFSESVIPSTDFARGIPYTGAIGNRQ